MGHIYEVGHGRQGENDEPDEDRFKQLGMVSEWTQLKVYVYNFLSTGSTLCLKEE